MRKHLLKAHGFRQILVKIILLQKNVDEAFLYSSHVLAKFWSIFCLLTNLLPIHVKISPQFMK